MLFIIFGSLLLCHIVLAIPFNEPMCLDSNFDSFIDTSHPKHSWVPCQWHRKDMYLSYLQQASKNTSSFHITFQCFHATEAVCQKAGRAFQRAGDMISNIVLFKAPVLVNATLLSFCQEHQECDTAVMTLGGSSPARSMPLVNDDGLTRLHPQALVKQFGLSDHPVYAPFDILSVFNADAPYWFEEDELPIQADQADFTFVILHEFMHGLGFYSGWNEYLSPGMITPDPSPLLANQFISMVNPTSAALHATQFLESAMDRLMSIISKGSSPRSTSDLTRQLNKVQVDSLEQLLTSPHLKPATDMGLLTTYPRSLGLTVPSQSSPILLETGLKPFRPGSSVSHVDYNTYSDTPDFLMRFMQDRGVTLQDAIARSKGSGPIGPLLLSVLEEIGYATVRKPENTPHLLTLQHALIQNRIPQPTNGSSLCFGTRSFYLIHVFLFIYFIVVT